jgi:hypothetical protein
MRRILAAIAPLALTLSACGASRQATTTVPPEAVFASTTSIAVAVTTPEAPTTAVTTIPTTTIPTTTIPTTTQEPVVTTTIVAPRPEAGLRLSPRAEYFPTVPSPYEPMPTLKVTVVNSGSTAMNSVVVNPVGVYSVPSSNCGRLLPGQSCSAVIQFCPTAPGSYPATLTVSGVSETGKHVHVSIPLHGAAG